MADSAAERARRSRRHKRGDHSLCDPARRCELLEQTEMVEAVATQSDRDAGRGPRGQQLWDALSGDQLGPLHRLLLDEACRFADRLDRLDAALERKETWLKYEPTDGGTVVITIDSVLAEYRQQAMALKSLVAEIRAAQPKTKTDGKTAATPAKKGGGLGDLNAKLAARRTGTAG